MPLPKNAGAFAKSVSAAGAVQTTSGRLVKIVVTTAGSAASLTVNDNAAAASGTVLFAAPGTAVQGTVYDLDVPCANGLYVTPGTGQTVLVVWD